MKQRLVIFTGKGGVGKTTLALTYAKFLKDQNLKVRYNSFYVSPDPALVNAIDVPLLDITVDDSAEIYIANKLNSKTIASWIMHTHFFKSLFQMIPGLGHMILLGHILKELEKDPELIIVLDSPASGHALTMFESSNNFKKIFKAGLIVNDIEKMKSQLEDPDFLKTYIIALPNELAVSEAIDLQNELSILYKKPEIIINNSFKKFTQNKHIAESELPTFLIEKIKNEDEVTNSFAIFPHVPLNNFKMISDELKPFMKELN